MRLIVHGGAGQFLSETLPTAQRERYATGLAQALAAGWAVLHAKGSAEAAVIAAVASMEYDSCFNAGRGAAQTRDGIYELDASIMSGRDRSAGAVTCVTRVPQPIVLAERIRCYSNHVLLAGTGAERFAVDQGLPLVEQSYFTADADSDPRNLVHLSSPSPYGTVGAVAMDADGHLAAATSTGGLRRQHPGRIGDSPLIGSGTWADDRSVAVSATGDGEAFIRAAVAHDIAARFNYCRSDLRSSCRAALAEVAQCQGRGGVIALDRHGTACHVHNSRALIHGYRDGAAHYVGFSEHDRQAL